MSESKVPLKKLLAVTYITFNLDLSFSLLRFIFPTAYSSPEVANIPILFLVEKVDKI